MARTDRLMRLMDVLRRAPAPVTAAKLAAETDVSLRQLYRDIATLRAGGALIDGEAGVGYRLTEDSALPPQSFSRLEIEALLLAVGELRQMGDPALEEAGRNALARIVATLPERQSQQALHAVLRSFRSAPVRPDERTPPAGHLSLIRQCCWDEASLNISYTDLQGASTSREVLPLGISYSDNNLMLLAFCQMRQDYRTFHISRITALSRGNASFRPQRVPLLRAYVEERRARRGQAASGVNIAVVGSPE
ncbi:YafY family transcriptional regulator [Paracoccus suum]|uniref:YafY family transcriptional regulator n=2 Tax=Paracoccus suum TaxID=2259340 RepID=A0A344PNZ6_9RHOB|nr:YafY family protein [Paracoccus suum]AXC51101.1 YafY family transcriptional regulator [Paracoccus suum]